MLHLLRISSKVFWHGGFGDFAADREGGFHCSGGLKELYRWSGGGLEFLLESTGVGKHGHPWGFVRGMGV